MRYWGVIAIVSGVVFGLIDGWNPAQAAPDKSTEVIDVRVAAHDDGTTRFVLELAREVPFTIVPTADGIAIDLPALDWRSRAAGLVRPVGLINGFTYGVPKPGSGRVLIYASSSAAVQKAFIVPSETGGNFRLVVDLAPPPQPAAASPQATGPPPSATENPILGHGRPADLPAPSLDIAARPSKPEVRVAAAEVRSVPDARPVRSKPTVMLDPGHGGVDPGTIGLSGEFEKEIVLALAQAVKERLDRDGKVKCLLTRDDDTFVPLPDRVALARAAKADLFVSMHADSDPDPQIRGLSVYTLSKNASDATAQALADKENKSDLVAGLDLVHANPEVTNILIDLVQRETLNLSAVFAGLVIDEVGHDTRVLGNTHRFAGFAVLKAPDVPSVLIETGYLSNRQDEQLLRKPEYRAKLAGALARAIERFFAHDREARRG
jgi:N-acetylmuramoyl-L-alanine amidase